MILRAFKFYFFTLCYITSFSVYSQTLIGTVKDSLKNSLQDVNIIAEPIQEGKDLKFAITDHIGRYRLMLEKKVSYNVSVSHIGYKTEKQLIFVDFSKKEHQFILKQKGEQLDEIVIKYKPKPILVKKDTLTYIVDYFKNGKEFKMIDILEKLPGFEVLNNGIITVQGKKVTKVFVENKPFFGGSTKLAIENIPADALEKIEVIDNFNEVDFLKQVSDSKEMIINVKLKKNKKEFIFGDVEAGAEIANDNGFYSLHAALFSYNQKTNLSYIGNLNNIGKRSFSFKDLMRFQNTRSVFIRKRKRPSNLYNIGKGNTDVLRSKSQFSALNLSFDINPKLHIESYGIFSKLYTTNLQESNIQYLENNLFSSEKRIFEKNNNELFALGNLKINYSPSTNSKLIYNGQFQFLAPRSYNVLQSTLNNQLKIFKNEKTTDKDQINHFFEWHKKFNTRNITTLVLNHSYENKKTQNNWFSNTPFLNEYITYQSGNTYDIQQIKSIKSNNIDLLIKHYLIVHNLHHLYINIGNSLDIVNLETLDQQLLSNGININLFSNEFENKIKYSLNNFYMGLEYKFKIGKWENKLSLYTNSYNLVSKQRNDYKIKTTLIEPRWNSDYEFNPTENIQLEYKFSNKFPEANQLLEQYTILNYNTIFKGNALLRNEKFHIATLNYSKHDSYKGLIIYANATFNKKIQSIRNQIKLIEINNSITPEMINTPENNMNISGMIEKQIHKFKISFRPSFSWSEYLQTINTISILNQTNIQNITLKVRTADKKLPKLSVGYRKIFSQLYGFRNYSLASDRINFSAKVDFFKHFTLSSNYEVTYNKNQDSQINNYQIANASINYKKRNTPLSFELSVQNILNNNIKIENSFSDYIILNNKIYTLPRIFMFSVRYKI